jgi:alcohol dehydrogenase (cytochrome c)
VAAVATVTAVIAQRPAFAPVTQEMLLKPSPDDWLQYSRTYDAQRFSPLKQINRQNVGQLKEVFKKELGNGPHESIPIVYRGVMYLLLPGSSIQAVDASTGALIWEHRRPSGASRAKTIAIYDDMVYYTSPDGFIVALDARTGRGALGDEEQRRHGVRRDRRGRQGHLGAQLLAHRDNCYIAGARREDRRGAVAFLHGGGIERAGRRHVGWRARRHARGVHVGVAGRLRPGEAARLLGRRQPDAQHARQPARRLRRPVGYTSPIDLYSNSTIALNPDTGKLVWYYQHLPGDDWDEDYPHERTLLRTAVSPDPKFVKWINPDVKKGEQRDVALMVGEGGGIFALDRGTGQFLWANPFPSTRPTSSSRTSTARPAA